MFLHFKMRVLLALWALCAAEARADSTEGSWLNKSYAEFCAQYGIGSELAGGMHGYRHNVGSDEVIVYVVGTTKINAIGVVRPGGGLATAPETVQEVVPVRQFQRWKGSSEELIEELPNWLSKSHLPFQQVFGAGKLFAIQPRRYWYAISESEIIVYVDSDETIMRIEIQHPITTKVLHVFKRNVHKKIEIRSDDDDE